MGDPGTAWAVLIVLSRNSDVALPQQEIHDVQVCNAVVRHVDLIQRHDEFR